MHDFLLAKEIIDNVLALAKEKNLKNIQSVDVEIGTIALAHDGFAEHTEDINLENLEFGLENIAKSTALKGVKFNLKKTAGESWSIANILI